MRFTPLIVKPSSDPVYPPTLKTDTEPVRFLDYLLKDTLSAVIVAKSGMLVNVPTPARYALHKLVTSQRRPAVLQIKKQKDISQAEQLLTCLIQDRPGYRLLAWDAAQKQPEKFMKQLRLGLETLPPKIHAEFEAIVLKS
ncbi:MAG: hypothetical protein COB30_013585 [Ectothiorhodospiraceae bacterium]|nr:hypothetical protein [Ectothiorhodospiraceae bacterium]